MRFAKTILWALLSNPVVAQTVMCGDKSPSHSDLLTEGQWRAVLEGKVNGDAIIEEAIAAEEQKRREGPTPVGKSRVIEWNQARTLILLGAVVKVIEHQNRSIMLIGVTGRRYTSVEPKISDVWRVTSVVDPCSIFIQRLSG